MADNIMLTVSEQVPAVASPTIPVILPSPELMSAVGAKNPNASSLLTLPQVWQRLWRQKWLFLTTLFLVLLVTALITLMKKPEYRAISTIQIEKQGAQVVDFGNVRQVTPDMGESDMFFRTQYEQLKGRQLAEQVISDLNLDKRLFELKEKPTPLGQIWQDAKQTLAGVKDQIIGLLPENTLGEKSSKPAIKGDNIDLFLKNLYVEPIEKAHLVKVYYESTDPVISAEIINKLIELYIKSSISNSSQTDIYAQAFLERELEKARERLTNSENEMVRYARDNQILEVNNSQATQEQKLNELKKELYIQSKSYDELVSLAKNKENMLQNLPAIQPVLNKDLKQMASGYGWRIDPVYHTRRFHAGMDFAAPTGADIYATGNGQVISAGWQQGYGNCVQINHGYGYVTLYGHMSAFKVRAGQKVKRGDVIGLVGSTGKSTGPHLHYEVHYKGEIMNPQNYYFLDLSPAEYDKMVQMSNNSGQMFD